VGSWLLGVGEDLWMRCSELLCHWSWLARKVLVWSCCRGYFVVKTQIKGCMRPYGAAIFNLTQQRKQSESNARANVVWFVLTLGQWVRDFHFKSIFWT